MSVALHTIETQAVQEALALASTLLNAHHNRIGKVDGKPGTGRSAISHYLVRECQPRR